MIKDLPDDIKLDAIEFRSNDSGWLSSVSCVLSNGLESPLFKKSNDDNCGRKTLSLKDMNIRGVHMEWERDDVYDHESTRIDFLGNGQELLCSYDPFRMTMKRSGTLLADNETLIGVYGAFDQKAWIRPFGFIVKVMPVPE